MSNESMADEHDPVLVREFLSLERRRVHGDPPLELAELTRWQELRDRLASGQGAICRASGNQRESLRIRTHLKVRVSFGALQQLLGVYNLSTRGVFLATPRPLEVGSLLSIEFFGASGSPTELEGHVVWARSEGDAWGPAGMGVELAPLSDWDRVLLAELLEAALPS
jgi:hypothetical protein